MIPAKHDSRVPLLPVREKANASPVQLILKFLMLFAALAVIIDSATKTSSPYGSEMVESSIGAKQAGAEGGAGTPTAGGAPSPIFGGAAEEPGPLPQFPPSEPGPSSAAGLIPPPPSSPRLPATPGMSRGSSSKSSPSSLATEGIQPGLQPGSSLSRMGSSSSRIVPLSPDWLSAHQETDDVAGPLKSPPGLLNVNPKSALVNPYLHRSSSPAASSSTSPGSGAPLLPGERMPHAASMENLPNFSNVGLPHSQSAQAHLSIYSDEERGSQPGSPHSIPRRPSTPSSPRNPDAGIELSEVQTYQQLGDVPPAPPRARCGHGELGYEVRVGLCADVNYHYIHLTWRQKTKVPLILDRGAECMGQVCTDADKWTCCRKMPRCLEFNNHVPSQCPEGTIPNQYEYAFCRNSRCTVEDIEYCCVPPSGVLFERLSNHRSDKARVAPSELAIFAEPHISFGEHDIAWVNTAEKKAVEGEVWAPLVNFMAWWGDNTGWRTPAWVKLTRDGKNMFRDLKLKVHSLTCETTLDDLPQFSSETDTYIVHCPKLCLGKAEVMGDEEYFRWQPENTPEYRKKGLPLYIDRNSDEPVIWGKFKNSDTFVSRAFVDVRGDTVWTEVRLQSDGPSGRYYWLPTIIEDPNKVPPFRVYTSQVAPDVKGCGAAGFMESEWFSSDSPICVAARVLNMLGGDNSDDYIELTVGPKQAKYSSCTHGGIQTQALADTSAVQRSFRLGAYGFEMMHRNERYIDSTMRSLWLAHTEGIRREGPFRVFVKVTMKGYLFYNLAFPISKAIDEMRQPLSPGDPLGTATAVGTLVLWSLCFIKPIIGLSISITIDTTMDYFHPRTRMFLNKKLDLGPPESVRRGKVETLGQIICRQMQTQYHGRIYIPFVLLEVGLTTLAVLKITTQAFWIVTARIAQLEIANRFKRAKKIGEYPEIYPGDPDWFPKKRRRSMLGEDTVGVGAGGAAAEPEGITGPSHGGPSPDDPLIDFSPAFINLVIQRIRELIEKIVPKDGEEPVYSRLDVLGWMAGLDLSSLPDGDDSEAMEDALMTQMESPNCILKDFTVEEDGTLALGASALPLLADNLGIEWELRQVQKGEKTIVFFALTHEDMAESARIMNQACPDIGASDVCPNIEIKIQTDGNVAQGAPALPVQRGTKPTLQKAASTGSIPIPATNAVESEVSDNDAKF